MKKTVFGFVAAMVMAATAAMAAPVELDSLSPAELESSDVAELAAWMPAQFRDGRAWVYVNVKRDIVVGENYVVNDVQYNAGQGRIVEPGEIVGATKVLLVGLEPAGDEPVDLAEITSDDLYKIGAYVTKEGAMLLKESIIVRDNVGVRKVGLMGDSIVSLWSSSTPEEYGTVVPAGTQVQIKFQDLPAMRVSASYEDLSLYGEVMPIDDVWSIYIPVEQGVELQDDTVAVINEYHKDGSWRRLVRSLAPRKEFFVASAAVLENRDQWVSTSSDLSMIHLETQTLSNFHVEHDEESGEDLVQLDIVSKRFRLSPNMRVVSLNWHSRVSGEWIENESSLFSSVGTVTLAVSAVPTPAEASEMMPAEETPTTPVEMPTAGAAEEHQEAQVPVYTPFEPLITTDQEEDTVVPTPAEASEMMPAEETPTTPVKVPTEASEIAPTEEVPATPVKVPTEASEIAPTEEVPATPVEVPTEEASEVVPTEEMPVTPVEVPTEEASEVVPTEEMPTNEDVFPAAEKKADGSEPAPTVPQGGSSGGGCNAAGSGVWALCLLPLLRRRIRF